MLPHVPSPKGRSRGHGRPSAILTWWRCEGRWGEWEGGRRGWGERNEPWTHHSVVHPIWSEACPEAPAKGERERERETIYIM